MQRVSSAQSRLHGHMTKEDAFEMKKEQTKIVLSVVADQCFAILFLTSNVLFAFSVVRRPEDFCFIIKKKQRNNQCLLF